MAPKSEVTFTDPVEPSEVGDTVVIGQGKVLTNQQLMPDAGKVPLDPAQTCGRGIVKDIKSTIGTYWVKVRFLFFWFFDSAVAHQYPFWRTFLTFAALSRRHRK